MVMINVGGCVFKKGTKSTIAFLDLQAANQYGCSSEKIGLLGRSGCRKDTVLRVGSTEHRAASTVAKYGE